MYRVCVLHRRDNNDSVSCSKRKRLSPWCVLDSWMKHSICRGSCRLAEAYESFNPKILGLSGTHQDTLTAQGRLLDRHKLASTNQHKEQSSMPVGNAFSYFFFLDMVGIHSLGHFKRGSSIWDMMSFLSCSPWWLSSIKWMSSFLACGAAGISFSFTDRQSCQRENSFVFRALEARETAAWTMLWIHAE